MRHFFVQLLTPATVLTLMMGSLAPAAGQHLGDPLPGLAEDELARFDAGRDEFLDRDDEEEGLGPVFNFNSCAGCHRSGAIGGAGRKLETRFGRVTGGLFDPMASSGGSLQQARALRAICNETIPLDATITAERQTTPLFGVGLVEAIPDAQIVAVADDQAVTHPATAGRVHYVQSPATNDIRVGRFGWKAQHADLLSFSGDAYLNEMGVTNRLFPDENAPNGDVGLLQICDTTPDPEDIHDNIDLFADFMQFLAPPPRGSIGASELAGEAIATNIGCLDCHRATYTAVSAVSAIDGQSVHAYSDFLLHDIGTGDGIVQGDAQGNEIRTAPLWGLRRSGPYLHDGRARRVIDAIEAHGGQAQAARDAFAQLPSSNRAALLKFLRSL